MRIFCTLLALISSACGSDLHHSLQCLTEGKACQQTTREDDKPVSDTPTPVGPQGPAGTSGGSCHTKQVTTGAVIYCDDGSYSTITNGTTCTVSKISNATTISCSDGSMSVVLDGAAGAAGEKGDAGQDGLSSFPSPYSVSDIIHLCDNPTGTILLRLENGQLLWHFSSGNGNKREEFLSVLSPGNYVTSDLQPCHFTVMPTGEVLW